MPSVPRSLPKRVLPTTRLKNLRGSWRFGPVASCAGIARSASLFPELLGLWRRRLRFLQSETSLMPISQVGHMYRDGRAEANLSRRIRSLARAHAVNPVAHVALAWVFPVRSTPLADWLFRES